VERVVIAAMFRKTLAYPGGLPPGSFVAGSGVRLDVAKAFHQQGLATKACLP
jgi:hypothetical protein